MANALLKIGTPVCGTSHSSPAPVWQDHPNGNCSPFHASQNNPLAYTIIPCPLRNILIQQEPQRNRTGALLIGLLVPGISSSARDRFTLLLLLWRVYVVTGSGTYLPIHCWLRREDHQSLIAIFVVLSLSDVLTDF